MNAWDSPEALLLMPTIWPAWLIPDALEEAPPKVPRSVMTPFCQRMGPGPALADADDLTCMIDRIGETDSAAGERPQVPRGRRRRALEVGGPVRPGRVVIEPNLPVPHVKREVDDIRAVDPLLVDRDPIEEELDRVRARPIGAPCGRRGDVELAEVSVQTVVVRLLDRQVHDDAYVVESTVATPV